MSDTTMYYAEIDTRRESRVTNLYTSSTYNGVVLPSSLPISREVFFNLLGKFQQGFQIYYSSNEDIYVVKHPIFTSIDDARSYQLTKINAKAEEALQIFLSTYPRAETISWDIQEKEARAYLADPTEETLASISMLPAMAEARQVDLTLLCEKVLVKAKLFSIYSGKMFGRRQYYEDQMHKTENIDEVLGIEVTYQDIIDEIYTALDL